MLSTRAISGHNVPIISWLTGHASAMIRAHGPEYLGGHGNLGAKIDAEAARTGVTPQEIGDTVGFKISTYDELGLTSATKIYNYTNGTLIKIPGVPDMYDWEYFPQLVRATIAIRKFVSVAKYHSRDDSFLSI